MQIRRVDLAARAAAPHFAHSGLLRIEFQHQRAVVKCAHEQPAAAPHRRRYAQAVSQFKRHLPVDHARLRVQRKEHRRMPEDELSRTARLDENRLSVAGLCGCLDRAPLFLAGHLVKRDERCALRACTRDTDHARPVHERRARRAPHRRLQPVVRDEIFFPNHLPGLRFEAVHDAAPAHHIHALAVHRRRRARAGLIRDARVVRLPFGAPQNLPGLLIETQRALDARLLLRRREVRHKHAPRRHRRPAVSAMQRRAPRDLQPRLREFPHDARLMPDPGTSPAPPLRPVLRVERARGGEAQAKDGPAKCGCEVLGHARSVTPHRKARNPPSESIRPHTPGRSWGNSR